MLFTIFSLYNWYNYDVGDVKYVLLKSYLLSIFNLPYEIPFYCVKKIFFIINVAEYFYIRSLIKKKGPVETELMLQMSDSFLVL